MTQKIHSPSFSGACLIVLIVSVFFFTAGVTGNTELHPGLMFESADEIPGYQLRNLAPWSDWEALILRNSEASLNRDFSDPKWASYDMIVYRAGFTRDLALAYQITKDEKYADKAAEGLLNIGLGDQAAWSRATALRDYGLAYDWIQPYLSEGDDRTIRNKYAELADTAYRELNNYGNNRDYISFADYHGRAYPCIAVAGLVLSDFKNPDGLSLQSTPDDWSKTGTEYLFINDELHSYKRPLITFGFDEESGKNYAGSYKSYVIADLLWWFQIYSSYYGRNIFDDYPVSKKIVTSEIWETLPNGYMNNYVTSGNTLETYHRGILNLLDDNEKGVVLNYLDKAEGKNILPYSAEYSYISGIFLYLVYGNYDNIINSPPSWTDHLNPDAAYQVFRENWDEDSDWLSLITFNGQTNSNRDMAHNDQLSIEYYSDGDLLLADGGENKYVLDGYYGSHTYLHNSIAVENPDSPYPVSEWADSESRGVFKGNANGLSTPADVVNVVETTWMVLLSAGETISNVVGNEFAHSYSLSSPIEYSRTIIRPFNEYFIIADSFESDEEWIYRNVFRPTSLTIIPTQDQNGDRKYDESETGHVVGNLKIGGFSYDWLNLPYKEETRTGINTDNILWSVTSPYGNNVDLNIFSVPSSEVIITKHVGRIAGYSYKSEVFSPVVYFRSKPAEELSRITLLLTGNNGEKKRSAEEIEVIGNGNAVKAYSQSGTDYIYSGRGDSEFDCYKTDAVMFFTRDFVDILDEYYLIFGGTYLTRDGLDFITFSEDSSGKKIKISGLNSEIQSVILDGLEISDPELDAGGNNISVGYGDGDHTIEIISKSNNLSLVIMDGDKSVEIINTQNNNSGIPVFKNLFVFFLFVIISLISVLLFIRSVK